MKSQELGKAFESISQRIVFSYQRQLSECAPVRPEGLSPSEQHEMQVSQQELAAFFRALYECVYDHPETFGLPLTQDVYMDEGDDKKTKQNIARKIKNPRVKMAHGIDFLYLVGRQGTRADRHLCLSQEDYAAFFAKSPRVKHKVVKGMKEVGLTVSEREDAVVVSNTLYPNMMPALKALAEGCAQRDDERMARFLFARCDFCALDVDYQPDILDLLRTALPPAEFERAVDLHHSLTELAYVPTLDVGGVDYWRIQYQGKRAIKTTPFFEFEYDERQKHQLLMRVKCASTNRLVPLLSRQPTPLQEDFFQYAHNCGAPKCSWCKTRKALEPSVLERAGFKKIICWWMRRQFTEIDSQAVDLVKQYVLLHEALAAA